jgi:hypothetical protein
MCALENQAHGRPHCRVLNNLTDEERADLDRALARYDSSSPHDREALVANLRNPRASGDEVEVIACNVRVYLYFEVSDCFRGIWRY